MPDGEGRTLKPHEVKTRADLDRLDQREYARLAGTAASRLDLLELQCSIADAFASFAEEVERAAPRRGPDEAG